MISYEDIMSNVSIMMSNTPTPVVPEMTQVSEKPSIDTGPSTDKTLNDIGLAITREGGMSI